jgi:hypothetical protein
MTNQYHEIITNAVTGEVTEVIRDWTAEEIAQREAAKVVAQPTVSELQAQLADIAAKLTALQGASL